MADSYTKIVLHTTFSTRYREPYLEPEIENIALRVITHHIKRMGAQVLAINGVPDHVHILHTLPRMVPISKLIQEAKKWSSRTIKQEHPLLLFAWQGGFASFSVSPDRVEVTRRYIQRQKVHHGYTASMDETEVRVNDFETEYRELLAKHGLEGDERFLFPQAPILPAA